MKKIKVGIIQQSNTADIRVNLMNLAKSIEACAAHGAQLIVLQELHNSLYFCQTENTNLFDLAEPIPGPSTGFYSELAAANKAVPAPPASAPPLFPTVKPSKPTTSRHTSSSSNNKTLTVPALLSPELPGLVSTALEVAV